MKMVTYISKFNTHFTTTLELFFFITKSFKFLIYNNSVCLEIILRFRTSRKNSVPNFLAIFSLLKCGAVKTDDLYRFNMQTHAANNLSSTSI